MPKRPVSWDPYPETVLEGMSAPPKARLTWSSPYAWEMSIERREDGKALRWACSCGSAGYATAGGVLQVAIQWAYHTVRDHAVTISGYRLLLGAMADLLDLMPPAQSRPGATRSDQFVPKTEGGHVHGIKEA